MQILDNVNKTVKDDLVATVSKGDKLLIAVFQYIEIFYNTIRIHSRCGYLSPNQLEAIYKKELDKLCSKAGQHNVCVLML